jgi:eukaryotic-like serine/threonine-protein kinase
MSGGSGSPSIRGRYPPAGVSETAQGQQRRVRRRGDLAAGDRLGPYVVHAEIGAGGMGVVYRAHDPRLDREIALKVISLRGLTCETGVRAHRRLLREAQAMAQLCHPNVLPVYDVGELEGNVWLAMERVRGCTLRQWSRRRHRSVDALLDMFCAAGRGIAAAHLAGLVHRDFKPDNVLVGDDGRVRVMDFGLVRAVAEPSEDLSDETPAAARATISVELPLTRTNVVMGTPAYMAPEQLAGRPVGPAADQFAFCVALFEALYGRRPFVGDTMKDLAQSIAEGPPSFPARRSVPRGIVRVIRRGLARRPEHRHPTMVSLLRALDRERREGPGIATVSIATACVLVGLGAALWPGPHAGECGGDFAPSWTREREDIQRRFDALPLEYAAQTFDRIAPRLDVYVDEWMGAHARACDARAFDRTAAGTALDCLAEQRAELDALVVTLGDPDAEVVERAAEAVVALLPVSGCVDRAVGVVALPEPAIAAQVARLRGSLAAVRARQHAGRYAEALASASRLQLEADAVGYDPVRAEVLHRTALLLDAAGAPAQAEAPLVDAIHLAQKSGHERLAAEAMTHLVQLLGDDLERVDEALEWARHAEAQVERLGSPPRLLADLRSTTAVVLTSLDRLDEARAMHHEALQLRIATLGAAHDDVAVSLTNLGNVAYRARRHDEAVTLYEHALEIRREIYGDDHPAVALLLHNLGLARHDQGQRDAARSHFELALEIRERAFGPAHPRVAATLLALATVDREDGHADLALDRQVRAFRIRRTVYGDDHPELAAAANELGTAFYAQQLWEEAAAHYDDARRRWAAALGPTHASVAIAIHNLGLTAAARGDTSGAREWFRQAVEIRAAARAVAPEKLARSLEGLAQAERTLGRHDVARGLLHRAAEVRAQASADAERVADRR